MQSLFIGQTYIDIVFLADTIPVGDDKAVARDYAVSFGGNAVTAADSVPVLSSELVDFCVALTFSIICTVSVSPTSRARWSSNSGR